MRTSVVLVGCGLRAHLVLDASEFVVDAFAFGRIEPGGRPVDLFLVDDVEHVLGWVFLWVTLWCAVTLKVGKEGVCIVSEVAEVDCLTALGEEQEVVELLEEDGGWLMDGWLS